MSEQELIKVHYEWSENESIAITDNGMSITNPYFQFGQALDGEIGSAETVKTVALDSKPPCKNLNGLGCPTDCGCADKE